ncbi:hypothetical protein ACSFCT_09210 [Yokenella regensburgei]|uniref:hypothetical protein n=1 Tax=Yokenella regensburgei TaxID=158877 RepID=UPI003ED9394D
MNNIIEKRRRRLVPAKLNSMMRRTGSYFQIVTLQDGSQLPIELDEDILTRSLIQLFETMIYEMSGQTAGNLLIANHYAECMGIHKLTPDGVDFMNAIITKLANESIKDQEGK